MTSITEKYPPLPLNEITKIANEFENYSTDQQTKTISRIIDLHPFLNFSTEKDNRDFYRARIARNGAFPFNYTGLLWNHSAPAQQARLNLPGDAVLYIANQANAAYMEVGVQNEMIILTRLSIQKDKHVSFLPLGTYTAITRSNAAHLDFSENHIIETRKKLLACPIHELQSLLIADEFIYNCIMNEDKDYFISSYTANLIFKKYASVDVISYPSKKLRAATNYAVKTQNFWEKWEISSAATLNVKHLALGQYQLSNLRSVDNIDESGFLSWQRSYPIYGNSLVPLNWKKLA